MLGYHVVTTERCKACHHVYPELPHYSLYSWYAVSEATTAAVEVRASTLDMDIRYARSIGACTSGGCSVQPLRRSALKDEMTKTIIDGPGHAGHVHL